MATTEKGAALRGNIADEGAADKGANVPMDDAMGVTADKGAHLDRGNKGSPNLRHILCSVLEHHGWRYVEQNYELMPPVADFPPSEWVNLLSLEDRAALAGACINYDTAAKAINAIDSSRPSSSMTADESKAIVNYIEVKSQLDKVVSRAHKSVLSVLARSFPFDPGGSRACNLRYCQVSPVALQAPVPYKRKRIKAVDVCSGQQSLAKFLLLLDPTAEILSLDIISYRRALSELPAHLHHRVKYVQYDVSSLTFSELQRLVREHLRCNVEDLYCIHFSPCCKSYSSADSGKNGYRLPDGTPNPSPRNADGSINYERFAYAQLWDRIIARVLDTITQVVSVNSSVLVSVENPTAMFRLHPSVRSLLSQPGWRLLEVDYCIVAEVKWDGDRVFTKKPTDFLLYGVPNDFTLPKCNSDCRFRFPESTGKSSFHLRSIRLDSKSVSGQVKQQGSLRHAIPCSLFARLFDAHDCWIASCASSVCVVTPIDLYPIVNALPHGKSKGSVEGPIRREASTSTKGAKRKPPIVVEAHPQATGQLTRAQRLYLLLHYRFGHASLRRLKSLFPFASILCKKNRVECPICMAAKATYKPHVGRLLRMSYAMGLVYFDIQGPFRIKDIDGNLYSLVLLDDYTDKKWQYRLRTRDELGSTLRQWIAHVGCCPERLRHDGAGENLGNNGINAVAQLCLERSIYAERTTPYQSQQMSRLERVHRVFLEAARCMIMTTPEATLDLWGYAFMHACFLDQFLSSDGVANCPYTKWHGEEPSAELLNSLRTWGSIVYFAHYDDRHKLELPGHKGMFLGYSPVTDACYVRDLDNSRKPVRITRDILDRSFTEDKHLLREPFTVNFEDYQLLDKEPDPIDVSSLDESADLPWEQVLHEGGSSVDKELQSYYKSFQAFAKERRLLLSKSPTHSPSSIEEDIKKGWRSLLFESAKRRMLERRADQLASDLNTRIGIEASGGTEASGGAKRKVAEVESTQSVASRKSSRLEAGAKVSAPSPTTPTTTPSSSGKFSNDIADIPCECCGNVDASRKNAMLICDGCNRGFHQVCYKVSVMPNAHDDWLCHSCIQPGMRISVYHKKDKAWHDGTVRAQLSDSMGTEVAYDDGSRALESLGAVKWRPIYSRNMAVHATLAHVDASEADHRNLAIWLSTTPRTLAHLKKFPKKAQELWLQSRLKEFTSIIGKEAAAVVDKSEIPDNAILVPTQWVFRIKVDGTLKSRLVLLGHLMPKDGELDLASPTPRLSTLRLILSIAMQFDLAVHVVDIDTAFTYARPLKTIYCSLPGGLYEDGRLDGKYLLLLRNLYGADSAPLMFHNLLHNWFIADGFSVNPHDPCLYIKWVDSTPIFALVHVDDVTLASTEELIIDFKQRIVKDFNVKDLGALGLNSDGSPSILLGMEIHRTDEEFQIRQTTLIDKILAKVGNELSSIPHEQVPIRDIRLQALKDPESAAKFRSNKPYRSILGVVGYIMLSSRNECAWAYSQLARYNDTFGPEHWGALLRLVSYLKKTRNTHYLAISKFGGMTLSGYCDSDWNGTEFMFSTSGWIVFFGSTPLSWAARLQRVTARSTGESEFIALSSIAQECVYLRMLVASLRIPVSIMEVYCNDKSRYAVEGSNNDNFKTAVQIWSDSSVALAQASKPEHWVVDKLRHIKTSFFFFKSYVREGALQLCKVSGLDNCADIFTKGFGAPGKTAANQKAEVFQRHALFCSGRRGAIAKKDPRCDKDKAASQ